MSAKPSAYAAAGVDIDNKMAALKAVRAANCDRAVAILQCGGTRPVIIGWIEKGQGRAVMRG